MNKRARTRLIGITAIILIAAGAIVFGAGSKEGAYYRKVSEISASDEFVGQRVKVGGTVVAGSWDKKSNPMRFEIRDEGVDTGPTIEVVYSGGVPSTFGDGVVAILTGTVAANGVLESDDMITKCPSKYESAKDALTVGSLLKGGENLVDKPVKVAGAIGAGTIVPPGGEQRFVLLGDSGEELPVQYEGALPEGMTDGSEVVVSGALAQGDIFVATEVAIAEEAK